MDDEMLLRLKENEPLYRRVRFALVVFACLMVVLGLYATWNLFLRDVTVKLRISSGREFTRRHQITEQIRDASQSLGIELEIVSSAGSEDALQQVNSGLLDLALVSTGMTTSHKSNVRELASFHIEPVHFLIRKELSDQSGLLRDIIRGKRVNLGEPGSTAYRLSNELLAFAKLKPGTDASPGDFKATTFGDDELTKQINEIAKAFGVKRSNMIQALPDAFLLVATMPSVITQKLIEVGDYQLVTLPFSRAFILHGTRDEHTQLTLIDHSYLEQVTIPAGSYLGTIPIPQKDCETIGLRLLLVANKDVPVGSIYRLMNIIFESELTRRIKPISAVVKDSPYPVHLGALAYENRNKPFIVNEVIEISKKIISAFGLFSAGALSIYALLRTHRGKSAADYLNEIRQIEQIARGKIVDLHLPEGPAVLAQMLDHRLAKLKSELIEACCKKQFKNEMMLLNILTILVDARQQVSKLLPQKANQDDTMKQKELGINLIRIRNIAV